jgi:hypothetical protein
MEDLEEVYNEGIEKEGEIFIEGLQNKKSLAELEKRYSQKVKEIRRIYERSLKKELNKENDKNQKKEKRIIKQEDGKEFQVQKLILSKTWEEEKEIEMKSASYRVIRKIKIFIQKITPNYAIYSYYKVKRILGDFYKEIIRFFGRVWDNIYEGISNILSYIKDGFNTILSGIIKITEIFKKKKSKDKEEEKKADAKENHGK